MTENALVFVTATPNSADQPAMREYLQKAVPLLIAGGGTLLGRGAVQKTANGNPNYKIAMAMAFENIEAAQVVFDSDDYLALKSVRDRGFTQIDIALAKSL